MAVKLGNGNWAVKEDKLLAYNDNSGLFFNKEFDFSRGTSATYVAKDGLIKTAGIQPNIVNNGDFATDSDWTKGSGWSISGGKAVGSATGASLYQADGANYTSGKLYKITFEVSDYVSGSVRPEVTNVAGSYVSSNGVFVQYITATSSPIGAELKGSTFTGSVDNFTVQEIQTDTPRIDFTNDTKGHLLLEPSRTNIITYSEDFSEWTNTRTSTSTDETLSPKGELFSYKLTETNDTGFHGLFKNETVSSGVSHTFSVFLKKGTSSFVQILFGTNNVSGNPYVNFDVNNGVLQNYGATSTKIEEYLNEWYRCSVTITTATTSLSSYVSPIQSITSSRVESFTGDINKYFYLFGAQLEAGSYPTSLIYTTGAASTRNADVCNNSGSAQDFNSEEGVLYAEIQGLVENSPARVISIGEGLNFENGIIMSFDTSNNLIKYKVRSNNITTVDISKGGVDRTLNHKIAVKYKVNDFQIWLDGSKVASTTSGAVPLSLSKIQFSDMNVTGSPFYGKVRNVQVFTEALTDEQLEKLTS